MLRTYRDAVAIVTGAGSGIGEALAIELALRGAHVVVTDRRLEEAERVARAIVAGGGRAEAVALDVRDARAVDSLIGSVFDRHGRLDYLFNNAGIGVGGEVRDQTLDDFRSIVEVNLMGVVHGVLAAYPRMLAQGFGHLVSTASMSGLMPSPMAVAYAMTKHGVVGFMRSLRIEAAPLGVRVSVLCPGVIRTPILRGGAFGRIARDVSPDAFERAFARSRPMEPDAFARETLDLVAENHETIIVPSRWRLVDGILRLTPAVSRMLLARAFVEMKAEFDRAVVVRDHRD